MINDQSDEMTACLAKWCSHHPSSKKSAYFSRDEFPDYYLSNREINNFGGKKIKSRLPGGVPKDH